MLPLLRCPTPGRRRTRPAPGRRAAAAALLLAACGGGGPTGSTTVDRVFVASGNLILPIGGTATLSAVAFDAGGATITTAFSWRSTAPTVASVTSGGVVSGLALGTAQIIASAGGKADTIGVTVANDIPNPVTVELVAIARDSLLLGIGEGDSLAAVAIGPGGTAVNAPITWTSANPDIASVSSTGRVLGVAPGVVAVVASAAGKADTVRVTVHGPLAVIQVTIDRQIVKSSDTTRVRARGIDTGGRPVPITPEWAAEDTTVALVTPSGLVFGKEYGRTTLLTATVGSIVGFTFVSVVPSEVRSIALLPAPDTVGLGTVLQLTAEVLDEFDVVVTDRPVTWTSSDPDVVSVSSSGEVLAVSPGTATVRASTAGFFAEETITVLALPQNVYRLDVINHLLASVRIFVNDSQVVVLPERASASLQLPLVENATVRWQLIRPKAGTAGEPLGETFPTFVAPTGVVNVEIDNEIGDKRYFTPLIRSLVRDKLGVEMPVRDLAGPCGCSASNEEDDRRLGYWPLRDGASVMIFDIQTPSRMTIIVVQEGVVEAKSGIWRTTILTAP